MDNSTHKVLFIQGGGEGVHDDWDGKLAESLRSNLGSGYSVVYPRMPDEADPRYESWKATLCDELATLGKRALLVGHSVGGTILIKAVAESPPRSTVDGIFLIAAPFVGEGGWISEELELPFELGARISESTRVYLYTEAKTRRCPAITQTSMREPYRTLWCAVWRIATTSSTTTCQRSRLTSAACNSPAQHSRAAASAVARVRGASGYAAADAV